MSSSKEIQQYDFKQGLPHEIEIISMSYLLEDYPLEMTSPHRAEFYQILWFEKGTHTHLLDFEPIEIKSNSLLFVNKGAVQRFDNSSEFEGKILLFTDNFFCKTESNIHYLKSNILFNDLLSVPMVQLNSESDQIALQLKEIEKELSREKDIYQPDILRNSLRNLLLHAERERRKQDFTEVKKGPDLDNLILFKELLEKQYRTEKQVGNYARLMNITDKRLNQATSKVLGKSPKQMIDERLMLEAKRLLAHTTESVKEIGFELGFDEPTNFVKYFKKHQNSTPIEFRESLKL
ncbi:MAG: AraC family transcriptional regulator [Cytophagales bacterium]|nr:AraC family transcriptional regulator [Cytophagales bacterium]